jgi:hypothetical protein
VNVCIDFARLLALAGRQLTHENRPELPMDDTDGDGATPASPRRRTCFTETVSVYEGHFVGIYIPGSPGRSDVLGSV